MRSKDILFLLLLIYITSDIQNTNVFSEGIPKARGYPFKRPALSDLLNIFMSIILKPPSLESLKRNFIL